MQNLVENYRMALAKRKAARRAEAKAHKHARQEFMHRSAEFWRERGRAAAIAAAEQREREEERNEFAGLVMLTQRNDYPQE